MNESEYDSVGEWKRAKPNDYELAKGRGLLLEICKHFGWKCKKPSGYWVKDRCLEDALKYSDQKTWRLESPRMYHAAARKKFLIKIGEQRSLQNNK